MSLQKLLDEMEVLKAEYEKFERGNKSAGTRARKSLQASEITDRLPLRGRGIVELSIENIDTAAKRLAHRNRHNLLQ